MSDQYDTKEQEEQEESSCIPSLVQQIETYLEPLLTWLDAYLDPRLVRTFVDAIAALLQFRGNQQALQLSELGAYLPCEGKEPAKTKRLQRLLTSTKWGKAILDEFIWMNADKKVREMKAAGERVLCLWDGMDRSNHSWCEKYPNSCKKCFKHIDSFSESGGKKGLIFSVKREKRKHYLKLSEEQDQHGTKIFGPFKRNVP